MRLFDFFRKKKKIKEKKVEEKERVGARPLPKVKPKRKVSGMAYPVRDYKGKEKAQRKQISNGAYRVLASPHVTEKATGIEGENKYIFKVLPRANKVEIKKAIEDLYGVDVIGVRIINIPKRQRKLGKQRGWRKGYKKAIIKIKKGQKIEIMPR